MVFLHCWIDYAYNVLNTTKGVIVSHRISVHQAKSRNAAGNQSSLKPASHRSCSICRDDNIVGKDVWTRCQKREILLNRLRRMTKFRRRRMNCHLRFLIGNKNSDRRRVEEDSSINWSSVSTESINASINHDDDRDRAHSHLDQEKQLCFLSHPRGMG